MCARIIPVMIRARCGGGGAGRARVQRSSCSLAALSWSAARVLCLSIRPRRTPARSDPLVVNLLLEPGVPSVVGRVCGFGTRAHPARARRRA
eukprot:11787694-Alexandrium_andersonii.AAC.1